MSRRSLWGFWAFLALHNVIAETNVYENPTYDRWMYPFNASDPLGERAYAPTFGALFDEGFDTRDGQFYFAFTTSNEVPVGLGTESYRIQSLRIEVTSAYGDYVYDPSYDAYTIYLESTNPLYQADADDGRPVELYGADFRNGYDYETFGADGPFNPLGSSDYYTNRNVYPVGFHNNEPIDVSNNIDPDLTGTNGFDPVYIAVGAATNVTAGDAVPADTTFLFDVDVADENIQDYLKDSLNQGHLGFVLTSLHAASFGGSATYPQWYDQSNLFGIPARMILEVAVMPPLHLSGSGTTLTIAWSAVPTGFVLEVSTNLTDASSWTLTTNAISTAGGTNQVSWQEASSHFFRLRKP